MMVRSLKRRVASLEEGGGGEAAGIRAEIRRLEAELAHDYTGDPDDWSGEKVEQALLDHFAGGRYQRLQELKERAKTSAERAREREEQRRAQAEIDAMTDEEIDACLAGLLK